MKKVKKPVLRCSECPLVYVDDMRLYMENGGSIDIPKGKCFCTHDDARAAYDMFCQASERYPAFIACATQLGSPKVKKTPRWCPRRLAEKPTEISKNEAYKIISTQVPHGLFFLEENGMYVGIDNKADEIWTEEFETKAECFAWLKQDRGADAE